MKKPAAASQVPRIHAAGAAALLMDVAAGEFDLDKQKRLWFLAGQAGPLQALDWVGERVLGVNNLLVTFDPLRVHPRDAADQLRECWSAAEPSSGAGRVVQAPVRYDASPGSDLHFVAQAAGLDVREVIELHTSVAYHVACVGFMPGFGYLVGLPARLATPRRATPRLQVPKGSVMIGGSQTAIMPVAVSSGWHILGYTDLEMFDLTRDEPSLLAPGDRVRFTVEAVTS